VGDENFGFFMKKNRLRGLFCGSIGLLLLLGGLGYVPEQCPWISTRASLENGPSNPIGIVGTYLSFLGISILGFSYFFIPLFLIRSAYADLWKNSQPNSRGRLSAMAVYLCCMPIFLALLQTHCSPLRRPWFGQFFLNGLGGWYGTVIYLHIFSGFFGPIGSILALIIPICFSFWAVFTRKDSLSCAIEETLDHSGSFGRLFRSFGGFLKKLNPLRIKFSYINPLRLLRKDRSPSLMVTPNDLGMATALQAVEEDENSLSMDNFISMGPNEDDEIGEDEDMDEEGTVDDALLAMKRQPGQCRLFSKENDENWELAFKDYVFPPVDLLDPAPKDEDSMEECAALGEELRATLMQFGIDVEIGEIQSGPVITRYEILPAPGVRVEKIENLDKNIALTLRAPSVRILAPIPGRNCVGIEIPNARSRPVNLRGILESDDWKQMNAEIPIVLGRNVVGNPIIADLTRMPHLLIAGSTGSGKTVCINSILSSFLFHASPRDLRLILVDPKIVEMQMYNRLPHMLLPTLTDPKKVPNALRWLIQNMEWRYQLFASVGVRNIAGFNGKVMRTREENERASEMDRELSPEERAAIAHMQSSRREAAEMPKQRLPYIVCVIDELADLMLIASDDIENSVTRLAQLARAAGIHLILATQRPSVNVITGVIKANLPSRIAFKVASKVDSRTILDGNGADGLLGRGDMLFLPPGASTLVRAQGAWVSDEEISRVVDFIVTKNGSPTFDRQAMAFIEEQRTAESP
jgi:S-DNA-T family DNA segregation ATPase FtsK/SpoIIIE